MNTTAPEKLDMQAVDFQRPLPFQFLPSLLRLRSGWFANHALEPTRVGHTVSAIAVDASCSRVAQLWR